MGFAESKDVRIYNMEVDSQYFQMINNGKKMVEGRKRSSTWSSMQKGDFLKIIDKETGDYFNMCVEEINYYYGNTESELEKDPVAEFLIHEGLKNVLPNKSTLREGLAVYYDEIGWNKEEVSKIGVMAIHLRDVNFDEPFS